MSDKNSRKPQPTSASQSSSSTTSSSIRSGQTQKSRPVVKDLEPKKDPRGGSSAHSPKGNDY